MLRETTSEPAVDQAALTFTCPATPLHVRGALRDVRAQLAITGVADATLASIELVLAEVLNNIVEHAYAAQPDGMIALRVRRSDQKVSCTIYDDGCPMPKGMLPFGAPADPDACRSTLAEGGFGWLLIRELTQQVYYQRISGRNRVNFTISTENKDAVA